MFDFIEKNEDKDKKYVFNKIIDKYLKDEGFEIGAFKLKLSFNYFNAKTQEVILKAIDEKLSDDCENMPSIDSIRNIYNEYHNTTCYFYTYYDTILKHNAIIAISKNGIFINKVDSLFNISEIDITTDVFLDVKFNDIGQYVSQPSDTFLKVCKYDPDIDIKTCNGEYSNIMIDIIKITIESLLESIYGIINDSTI